MAHPRKASLFPPPYPAIPIIVAPPGPPPPPPPPTFDFLLLTDGVSFLFLVDGASMIELASA